MSRDYFQLPPVTERNLMPYLASLMTGVADRVDLPGPDRLALQVRTRAAATFRGDVVVWDGNPVPVGLQVDEEMDVVVIDVMGYSEARDTWAYDSASSLAVMRRGARPVGGVSAGRLFINSGTLTISTSQQLAAEKPEFDPENVVLHGSVSDYASIYSGHGDGSVDVVALVDADGAVCGVVHGAECAQGVWEGRILPGEKLMSSFELAELMKNSYSEHEASKTTPVVVVGPDGPIGHVWEMDYDGRIVLFVHDIPRSQVAS